MAKQTINIGASPNDGTGTPLRTAFDYTNQNFTELYTATGPSGNNIVVPGSATITGALDAARLNVTGATIPANGVYLGSANNLSFSAASTLGMTLNATGLGVGASPAQKLTVAGSAEITGGVVGQGALIGRDGSSGGANYGANTGNTSLNAPAGGSVRFNVNNGTFAGVFDANANLGIGVTPYTSWPATSKALQLGASSAIEGRTNDGSRSAVYTNAVWNGTNLIYQNTAAASYYLQSSGIHSWHNAASGTAGNTITFTQAMTLDATGQLLLGTPSTNGAVDIGMVMNKPSATGFVGNVYQLSGVDKAFAYIASAASAYTTETVSGYIIKAVSATNGVYLPNGGTSWLALSDERFKDIIEPISNAVAKVGSLRSVIGKFKTESEGTRRPFLIAQDVQAVLPEAVDATKPDQLGVSYSDVIPLLVAAIKELTARVQTLETR